MPAAFHLTVWGCGFQRRVQWEGAVLIVACQGSLCNMTCCYWLLWSLEQGSAFAEVGFSTAKVSCVPMLSSSEGSHLCANSSAAYKGMCECVCVCVYVHARACAYICVCVCSAQSARL